MGGRACEAALENVEASPGLLAVLGAGFGAEAACHTLHPGIETQP